MTRKPQHQRAHAAGQGLSRRGILGVIAAGATASTLLGVQAYGSPADGRSSKSRSAAARAAEKVKRHMEELDAIAARHGGNRGAGLPGFEHSARYVEDRLKEAGYKTRRQPFNYSRTDHVRNTVKQVSPQERAFDMHTPAEGLPASPDGGHKGELVAPSDSFGDAEGSWKDVDAKGKIALLELRKPSLRGAREERVSGCHGGGHATRQRIADDQTEAARKALTYARAAGISAVLFYLEGADIGIGLRFDAPGDKDLPPASVLWSTDAATLREDMDAGGATMHVDLELRKRSVDTFNVLTVPPDATTDRHLFGAHLDSVPMGPGIDDNGSGSALLLDLALAHATRKAGPVEFCWWGGEEDGLLGSQHYVDTESLKPVRGYFNMDMVAAPNYVIGVYGDGLQSHYTDHFETIDQPWLEGPVDGMSDQVPFLEADVPVAGIDTVRSSPAALKDDREAELFGGVVGEAFDPHYHAEGDTIANTSMEGLGICAVASHAALSAVTG